MTEEPNVDPLNLIDAMTPWIESLRGIVAVLVAEGFTDREARALTVEAILAARS